jgi:hypothetical protein
MIPTYSVSSCVLVYVEAAKHGCGGPGSSQTPLELLAYVSTEREKPHASK